MKLSVIPALFILLAPAAWADNNGGLEKGEAPPPPHALDDGYRGTDDARIMTINQAKEMHDGASISLRGNLIDGSGDKYVFQDKTGKIDVIIPKAVFDDRTVTPDQMISINGSLDKKSSPPVVRVDRLQK
ncbi:YdeI family stress tolerance OB fold protein [Enterobacter wuhouensis]|uniref:YdeI family stress tolerance OB fold protein n=1 Tax=Enterobacter wuhouensis TaxID=2529381 RepID=UPI0021E610A8|nr:YdeI family stress tolerance OB fold protein [Enterobacter wuhouensis]MCV2532458.1 YdeI family stress tolerance OB fold protein [Enterobacter wuhouensis]